MNTVISVQNLSYSYGITNILEKITFDIEAGDYVGLVGHNGSGKTTLIKLILGLLKLQSGSISLFGKNINDFSDWKKIGYVPQNISFYNPLFPASVEEVVSIGRLSTKSFPKQITKDDHQKVDEVLQLLEINHLKNKIISQLSGGQQQRVFLAKALVNRPELLILDEPSNALDFKARESFYKIIKKLNKQEKTTVILITHDVSNIADCVNKILHLEQKIIFYGNFKEFCLKKNTKTPFDYKNQHFICHQHKKL